MEPPSPYRILILNDSGRKIRTSELERTLQRTLALLEFLPGELSLRLTTNEEIQALNRQFREIDEPTDVLTFPAEPDFPTGSKPPLGDIAISVERAEVQAASRGISTDDELGYLAVHGILHLHGLDDETDEEREHMLAEMSRIGAQIGLPEVENWHTLPVGASA